MVFWVVITDSATAEVLFRRPCGSLQAAKEHCEKMKEGYPSCGVEIKPLPRGQYPQQYVQAVRNPDLHRLRGVKLVGIPETTTCNIGATARMVLDWIEGRKDVWDDFGTDAAMAQVTGAQDPSSDIGSTPVTSNLRCWLRRF